MTYMLTYILKYITYMLTYILKYIPYMLTNLYILMHITYMLTYIFSVKRDLRNHVHDHEDRLYHHICCPQTSVKRFLTSVKRDLRNHVHDHEDRSYHRHCLPRKNRGTGRRCPGVLSSKPRHCREEQGKIKGQVSNVPEIFFQALSLKKQGFRV